MKTLRWALVLLAGLLLPRAAGWVPGAVEVVYGRALYPLVAAGLGVIGRAASISLAQFVIVAAVLGVTGWIARSTAVSVRRRSLRRGFGPPHRFVAAAAIAVWSFHLLWGLNYARPGLQGRLSLDRVHPDTERLAGLLGDLTAEVNRTWFWANEDQQILQAGAPPASESFSASTLGIDRGVVADRIAAGYGELQPPFGRLRLSSPKFPRIAGWFMTKAGISGFYFPFTGEATVNAFLPDAAVPFVMAHEMAHQRGTAPEDEANFWAYLACRESGLASARYSGALAAWGIAYGALARAAPESAQAQALLLDPGPRADRRAIHAFWARHHGPASEISGKVNDVYLKTNAQTEGIESYGAAVEYLLAFWESAGMAEE